MAKSDSVKDVRKGNFLISTGLNGGVGLTNSFFIGGQYRSFSSAKSNWGISLKYNTYILSNIPQYTLQNTAIDEYVIANRTVREIHSINISADLNSFSVIEIGAHTYFKIAKGVELGVNLNYNIVALTNSNYFDEKIDSLFVLNEGVFVFNRIGNSSKTKTNNIELLPRFNAFNYASIGVSAIFEINRRLYANFQFTSNLSSVFASEHIYTDKDNIDFYLKTKNGVTQNWLFAQLGVSIKL
ncbi:MAG: hypothetical protein ACPGLV_13060 [Bacteroidia bacterium]